MALADRERWVGVGTAEGAGAFARCFDGHIGYAREACVGELHGDGRWKMLAASGEWD